MPKTNTLIKICGLTSEEQALQVAKLGAHAIGIISVEESPRYISAEIKKNIFTTLERFYPKIERVTVCLLYTSPSPRDLGKSRMPSSA